MIFAVARAKGFENEPAQAQRPLKPFHSPVPSTTWDAEGTRLFALVAVCTECLQGLRVSGLHGALLMPSQYLLCEPTHDILLPFSSGPGR